MRKPGGKSVVWALVLCCLWAFAGCKKSEAPPSASAGKNATELSSPETAQGDSDQAGAFEAALEQPVPPAPTASHEPSVAAERGTIEPDFDPFLFRHRDRTMEYVVEIPPKKEEVTEEGSPTPTPSPEPAAGQIVENFPDVVKVNLKDKSVVRIRVAVECADEATMAALKANPENQRLVQAAIENRTSDELLTLQGKMEFKDELIRKLKASMSPQVRGIKDVHLMELTIGAF